MSGGSMIREEDYEAKSVDMSLWKRLFGYALQTKGLVLSLVALMLVVGVIDIAYPLLTRYAIDHFIIPRAANGLATFIIVYVIFVCLQSSCTVLFISRAGKLEMEIAYRIREDAFLKLQELSFSFYDKTAVGYLLARMISDVSRLSELLAWSIVDVGWAIVYIVGCIIAMLILNWKLALIVFLVIPPMVIATISLQKKILKYQRAARKENSKITGAFNEEVMGAMTTKTLVREDANEVEFKELTDNMEHLSVRSQKTSALLFPLIISLGSIGTCVALSLGGNGVLTGAALIGSITAGTLVSFVNYTTQLWDPVHNLAGIFAELQSAQASAERVIDLIDTELEIKDRPDVIEKYGDTLHPKKENWEELHGDVEFQHVSFSYIPNEPILIDFNLKVEQGKTIALVGETGAGKSTIVNLICRFYEPTEGSILIDGKDYRERSQLWLQSHLGYVLQSPHLFSGTIRDNIAFGRPDATDEQIQHAAELVHADDFIAKMEKGYGTEVGEGGARLSVGQKQLISFARVMLADPRIFVLDEATSSIDTETEQLIQDAIVHVLKGRTSFIVAHRLSTIRNADQILVIQNGRITESGTHEELMALKGYYQSLYSHQFREEATQQVL